MESVFISIYFNIKIWYISSECQKFIHHARTGVLDAAITNDGIHCVKAVSQLAYICDIRLKIGLQIILPLTRRTAGKLCVKHYWKDLSRKTKPGLSIIHLKERQCHENENLQSYTINLWPIGQMQLTAFLHVTFTNLFKSMSLLKNCILNWLSQFCGFKQETSITLHVFFCQYLCSLELQEFA